MTAGRYARTELPGGLVVLTERMPGVRSAATGVWVRYGSAHERSEQMGAAHLLEHMVFKGTERRAAREIALVLERLGGSLDAYTTREHTSYLARVLDQHLDTALDVLGDLVRNPLLREPDLELEREVVLEEISTVDDTPDDLIFEIHADALWSGHPYGYRILGTRDTVARLSTADLQRLHGSAYRSHNLILAAAGNVDHDHVVERAGALFDAAGNGGRPPIVPEPDTEPKREVTVERDTAQTHIVSGVRTVGHADPRRYALVLLSNAFGGGMSSRLFQRVREELGLAYSVYAFQSFYRRAGLAGVYVGTRPEWAERAVAVVREEQARLAREGLTAQELEDTKGQVKGQLMLAMESTSGRLHRLVGFELYEEPYQTLDELIARVDEVTLDTVAGVARQFFDPDRYLLVRVGPGG